MTRPPAPTPSWCSAPRSTTAGPPRCFGRDYLVRLGIPDNAALPLVGGHDTFTSIDQVKRWFDGRDSRRVLLVSDGFHMLRLRIIARRLGLTPYTSPATGSPIHANVRRNAGYLFAEGFKVPFTWLFQR